MPLVLPSENLLRVVYDCRPLEGVWDDFTTVRARLDAQWPATPRRGEVVSAQLRARVGAISPAHGQALG
jgi:nicotinamide phosphoribosyltransferase